MPRSLALCSLFLICCGTPSTTPDAGHTSAAFIALAGDFDGFETWTRYDLGLQEAGSVHFSGERSVFLNKAPPSGSTSFPVGTVLVKIVHPHPDAGLVDQVFAMAKRGGEFNDAGAVGWEWFELDPSEQPPVLVWRGALPPTTRGYGGGAGGACTECHGTTTTNDSVLAPQLLLSKF